MGLFNRLYGSLWCWLVGSRGQVNSWVSSIKYMGLFWCPFHRLYGIFVRWLVSSGSQGTSGINSIWCVGLFCGSLSCALVIFIGLFCLLLSKQRRSGHFGD